MIAHRFRVVLVALALTACDAAERRDAESVVAAVGRFRSADLPSTPAAVEALKSTPCHAAEPCAAKATCTSAGDSIATALRLKSEVSRGIASVEKGVLAKDSAEAKELPAKLDAAEVLLKKGLEGLPACDDQVRALKRKHRI